MRFKILILLLLYKTVLSLRILSVFPSVTKSHYICSRRIIFELLNRGHEVVLISPFRETQRNLTWIEVEVSSYYEAVPSLKDDLEVSFNFFTYLKYVWSTMNGYTKYIINKPKLMEFIQKDRSHFDLIFAHDFYQPFFYSYAYKYRAPIVLFSTFGISSHVNDFMGNTLDVFEKPHEFSEVLKLESMFQRFRNLIYTIYSIYGRKYYVLDEQDKLTGIFGLEIPNLRILERNVCMVFLNSHPSMNGMSSLLPNMVEIGGAHIEEVKPLNKDLQHFLDGAKHGAILMSFGSFFDLSAQPDGFISNILQVLAKLQQRVIIKWNSKRNLTYNNIYTAEWLPQNDILAHKNIVLFITHGGLLSSQESIYHGIPVLCIPIQATQPKICRTSEELGYGLEVKDITSQNLENSIKMLLSMKKFKENAVEVSKSFRNRLVSPVDEAVYWLENSVNYKHRSDKALVCPFAELFLSILVIFIMRIILRVFWK